MTNFYRLWCLSFVFVAFLNLGCQPLFSQNSDDESSKENNSSVAKRIPTVDVAIADEDNSDNYREYVGTTEPKTLAILRSQGEGRLLDLQVAVGDRVDKNQVVGSLDDSLLAATVQQERGELASLESELIREQLNIKNAQINLQEALINLEQAKSDAQRYKELAEVGAVSQQQAESFQTTAKVAQQTVFLAQEEVNIAKVAATTAMGRIAAQQAAIAESVQRQSYSQLTAPITGIVVNKNQEPGNLVREGEEILSIGDFSAVKIFTSISAVDLNLITIGQTVEVELDALEDKVFSGRVTKINPVANTDTRKIGIEVTVINPNNQIKGGLLALVQLPKIARQQVSVPQSAITEEAGASYVFVVTKEDAKQREAKVSKRPVEIDELSENRAFIKEGLQPGEKYVIRSSQPLKDNETVDLSILSE